MSGNYKVKIKDIQNKYKFKIFCASNYDDSELKKMYEAIYMALPKETATGISNTLNDTAKSFMMNKLYATDTTQNTTTGKNLINVEEEKTFTQILSIDCNIPAGTYHITNLSAVNSLSTNSIIFRFYDNNVSFGLTSGSDITKTLSATETKIYVYSNGDYSGSTGISATIKQLMVSLNGGDYEPYTNGASPNPDYPQVIHTINGDNKINVEGKNLAIKNIKGYFNAGANTITVDGDSESFVFYAEEGKTYTYGSQVATNRGVVAKVDTLDIVNMTPISNARGLNGQKTFTSEFTGYCLLYVNSSKNDAIKDTFIVNKGDSASTYEPYQSNSVLLTLGDKEICWIGNYKDRIFKAIKGDEIYDSLSVEEKNTLDYGKWYLHKEIEKLILNGSETWTSGSTSDNNMVFSSTITDNLFIPSENNKSLCNNFTYNASVWNTDNIVGFALLNVNYSLRIRLEKSRLSDTSTQANAINSFKNWLSTHNTIVYYVLETPTNEKFNDIIQEQLEDIYYNMLSYEGQINISQINNDLPFNINSSALKDLSEL